jgi:hypothetical protein
MIGLSDGIEVDDRLASPLGALSRPVGHPRHGQFAARIDHLFWERRESMGRDICASCGQPESAHVEPAASVEATVSGDSQNCGETTALTPHGTKVELRGSAECGKKATKLVRDPRIEPRAGDKLRRKGMLRTYEIAKVGDGVVYLLGMNKGRLVKMSYCATANWPLLTKEWEIVHVEPAASVEAAVSGEAKTL